VEGSDYLGGITLLHQFSDHLREVDGHISYDVRPTARRQGHATAMLRAVLPRLRNRHRPALVTCDVDNLASARVIEAKRRPGR
jgi:predicted acetyltransferase